MPRFTTDWLTWVPTRVEGNNEVYRTELGNKPNIPMEEAMQFAVGDTVIILKGGYANKSAVGLQDGDTAVIGEVRPSSRGYYVKGLPGTPAAENCPTGLYFLEDELAPAKDETLENVEMEHEGKYFFTRDGNWVVGPLAVSHAYISKVYLGPYGNTYHPDTLDVRGPAQSLDPQPQSLDPQRPVDVTQTEQVYSPPVGTCVLYNGRVFWVERDDLYEVYLRNQEDGWWVGRNQTFTTLPSLNIQNPVDSDKTLVGKWVFSNSRMDYVKVREVRCRFSGFTDGFKGNTVVAIPPGSSYSDVFTYEDMDLTKVAEQHPREQTLIKSVQGEGPYMYALNNKGEQWLVWEEYGYFVFFNINKPHFDRFNSLSGGLWWEYQIFRTNELPFTLPYSYEACVASAKAHYNGGNSLTNWLGDNAPEALMPAIFSRAKMASNTRGNIALYLNEKQMETQRIQSLRPGRALRQLLPKISDKELEILVDKFRKDFPTGDYTLRRGRAREDFKRAYSGAFASMQNPQTHAARKSLANSCMRHSFDHLKVHPAEVYASGEFEMLWTETPDGKIGSRMVVWYPDEGKPQCGPVYGTCEYSMDMLQDLMVQEGGVLYEDASWVGAKLLRIAKGSDCVYVPYIDMEQGLSDDGEYLTITNEDPDDADLAGNTTGGYQAINTCRCGRCGDRMEEYDSYYTEDNGDVCEHCYSNYYFTCEVTSEVYPDSESCQVRRTGYGRQFVCESARDDYYTLCTDGDYWWTDDVVFLANGDAISPDNQGDICYCDYTNEAYYADDVFYVAAGGFMCRDYYESHRDQYQLNTDNEVEEIKEEAA